MYNPRCSTYVNGFYYWLAKSKIGGPYKRGVTIRYFDMHNQVFGEIPGPVDYTIYKESFCLLVRHCGIHMNPPIDVWLLNEDRSWTKVVNVMPTNIDLLNVVPTISQSSCDQPIIAECEPLGFWDGDKLIFAYDKKK